MDEQRPALCRQISQEDWERTPATVKQLVEEMAQRLGQLEKQLAELQAQQQLLTLANQPYIEQLIPVPYHGTGTKRTDCTLLPGCAKSGSGVGGQSTQTDVPACECCGRLITLRQVYVYKQSRQRGLSALSAVFRSPLVD